MAQFYIQEQANLFAGTADPSNSRHLTLEEIRLPTMQEKYQDHSPGGGSIDMEIPVGFEKLMMPFKLRGHDPDMFGFLGTDDTFTSLGLIRDRRTGRAIQSKAIMRGRIGQITPDAFKKGELQGHEYMVNAVMRYELFFDGERKILWDAFTNELEFDGVDRNAEVNRIIGLT